MVFTDSMVCVCVCVCVTAQWHIQIQNESPNWRKGNTWPMHGVYDRYRSCRELGGVQGAKIGDYLYWALSTGSATLDPKLLAHKQGGVFNVHLLRAYERCVDNRHEITQADVAMLLLGPTTALEVLRSNVEGDDTYHDATIFNPRYCHMTQAEARSAATDEVLATTTDVACVLGPSRVPAVDIREAIGYQVEFLSGMRMPAQQHFRHVNWLGPCMDIGKSWMLAVMEQHLHAMTLTNPTGRSDAIHTITTWMRSRGHPPHIIALDITKEASGNHTIPYDLIEELCDGTHVDYKYQSSSSRRPKAHVVVCANCLPRRGKMSPDRYTMNGFSTVIDLRRHEREFRRLRAAKPKPEPSEVLMGMYATLSAEVGTGDNFESNEEEVNDSGVFSDDGA